MTRGMEGVFPEFVALVRALPVGWKEQLPRMLAEEEAGLSIEDEALLSRILATFREELCQPLSTDHAVVLEEARQWSCDSSLGVRVVRGPEAP